MDYDIQSLGPALRAWAEKDLLAWIGDSHAALISMVGHGAIDRTTIDTGKLVNNWQGWIGPSSIASSIPAIESFSTSPSGGQRNIEALANEVRSEGRSGKIVEHSLIVNNAHYALVEEEQHGKHMALGAIDSAENRWGD